MMEHRKRVFEWMERHPYVMSGVLGGVIGGCLVLITVPKTTRLEITRQKSEIIWDSGIPQVIQLETPLSFNEPDRYIPDTARYIGSCFRFNRFSSGREELESVDCNAKKEDN